jgi:hypothetical protein
MNVLKIKKSIWMYKSLVVVAFLISQLHAQNPNGRRSGFTWISTESVNDKNYGAGYTMYSAAYPAFRKYPGPDHFQTGLSSSWLSTQRTGTEPSQFYTTIEGGLGWWHDTRFGTHVPKFIMGGVSHNFFAWANGPGAGQSNSLPNGERDWSTPGGKYGVAQLSNRLLWAPDGLNMAQSLNGELLGYGYIPLPLTDPIQNTNGTTVKTGNQCWTLFLDATNFKGPATFFVPTFWTDPVRVNPSLEGLYLDTRPSEPNVGFGIEHAGSPALISTGSDGKTYAKVNALQYPVNNEDNSVLLSNISVYSKDALWNDMEKWFNGGPAVKPGINKSGIFDVNFVNNGGAMIGEIEEYGQNPLKHEVDMSFMSTTQQNQRTMGFAYELKTVTKDKSSFRLPEYFMLNDDKKWTAVKKEALPTGINLLTTEVYNDPRPELTYLSPKEPDCHIQDPNSPWNSPGPVAGPFKQELGDGSTVTYYWYKFINQPAIVHAKLPAEMRAKLQQRVELIHRNWSHTDTYLTPPTVGKVATLDPSVIIQPPPGLEIGYVPIVTRQEKSQKKIKVFVLAGQSNMEGYGQIEDAQNDPGTLVDVIAKDTNGEWSKLGKKGNWTKLKDAYLYYERPEGTVKSNVTVGQGAYSDLIGPELMFAHQLDEFYDDPILIIKTAYGGRSLAVDFRPPSASGATGDYYTLMIDKVKDVTKNIKTLFPGIGTDQFEIKGFGWFQGWNDGASDEYLNEYESNMYHLINDVRKDLGNAELPCVIASVGHGGYEQINDSWVQSMQNVVHLAQLTVGCNDSIYGGHVGFVDTKPFYINLSASPEDAIYHYNNNALTFLNVGKSMGDEMIKAINETAFCYEDCAEPESPGVVSIGNRVWNDLNRNGINEPDEPGIAGVSVVLWSDPDGDGIPDWQGFGGVRVTDENGYYKFSGLKPGPYIVFVWQVNNWNPGEPLHGFVSSKVFEPNADNNVDNDNNGLGNPKSDIKSGIVILTSGDEPLNDGDKNNCYFDYDSSGNNSVDFGFYDPLVSSTDDGLDNHKVFIYPVPVLNGFKVKGLAGTYQIEIYDALGRILREIPKSEMSEMIDISALSPGMYFVKTKQSASNHSQIHKIVKQ